MVQFQRHVGDFIWSWGWICGTVDLCIADNHSRVGSCRSWRKGKNILWLKIHYCTVLAKIPCSMKVKLLFLDQWNEISMHRKAPMSKFFNICSALYGHIDLHSLPSCTFGPKGCVGVCPGLSHELIWQSWQREYSVRVMNCKCSMYP